MTWNSLTNLAHEQLVTETHMDQIRENIEHLGAMKFAEVALSSLTAISAARIATGTYTGNGAATQAISGLGFQPKFVTIWRQNEDGSNDYMKSDQDGTYAKQRNGGNVYKVDHIVSLDGDGFTVGDGTGDANYMNVSSKPYAYTAWG